MSNYEHHDPEIDEYDLKRIAEKSIEIGKIIAWLKKLSALDKTIDESEISVVIGHLKEKQSKLEKKCHMAQQEMIDVAFALAHAIGE